MNDTQAPDTQPEALTPAQVDATTDELTPEEEAFVERAAAIVDHVEPVQPREHTLHAADTLAGSGYGFDGVALASSPMRLVLDFAATEAQRATIEAKVRDQDEHVTLEWADDGRSALLKPATIG